MTSANRPFASINTDSEDASWELVAASPTVASWTHERSTREQNKSLRRIYEDAGIEYGKDVSEDELSCRLKKAVELRKSTIADVFKLLESSQAVDLCFLVDVTGSMSRHIDEVRDSINTIVTKLTERRVTVAGEYSMVKQLRLAFVGYRDHGDAPRQFEVLHFTQDIEHFRQFLFGVRAEGGDDAPEDVFGGLYECGKLMWSDSAGTNIIIHIADAPCHGLAYHSYGICDDTHPSGDPAGRTPATLFAPLLSKNIQYHFGKISNSTDKMIVKFAKAYGKEILEFDIKNPSNMFDIVTTIVTLSCSMTISNTIGRTALEGAKQHFPLDTATPNWAALPILDGARLSYKLPESIQDVVNGVPMRPNPPVQAAVQIAHHPFTKGAERYAFMGRELTGGARTDIVLKQYIRGSTAKDTAVRYEGVTQMQTIAAFFASEFSEALKEIGLWHCIKFLKVYVLSVSDGAKGRRYMSYERRFTGAFEYMRFSNNVNYEMLESTAATKGINMEDVQLLMAFSHWTHHVTGGYLMVVDLQGILSSGEDGKRTLELTDPAIHCKDITRFGRTNLGPDGMQVFFKRHCCNEFCEELGLRDVAASA